MTGKESAKREKKESVRIRGEKKRAFIFLFFATT